MVNKIFKPEFLRFSVIEQKEKYFQYIKFNSDVERYDTIQAQLKELIKNRYPKQILTQTELVDLITDHLNGVEPEAYGVWVYYPWSKRLVHLLDENEFVELRTVRNHYKITHEEEQNLSTKKICIIGLSVGQSVALTLAMERCFGELRLADFDMLDLSNLNRLRAGVHQIGLAKTIICAREIAEIDPFLKVTIFETGINENNIDSFFTEGGLTDLLIEECDSLEIKVLARIKAKQYKVPVIMETSDRGMLDIERYDLEPDRAPFHGLIPEVHAAQLKEISSEKRMDYLLAIAGSDYLSERMKVSMLEMNRSITGWPQLASSVVMGGGVAAEMSRKILLGQSKVSGRYYIDLDKIIS
ncbi:MAG: ThiF family adenylyltransferase [Bacteroidia bacterium]|nr:ThiF family adenylyltransferase [Bacteroidia bacterium]